MDGAQAKRRDTRAHANRIGGRSMTANIFDYKGKRAHFIGIGGSSMSGLAGYLHQTGYTVTGSDRTRSHKTEHLEAMGIPVAIGHDAGNVRGADVIVYSAAIGADNAERR